MLDSLQTLELLTTGCTNSWIKGVKYIYNSIIGKEATMADKCGCGCGAKTAKPEKKGAKPVKKSGK